MKVCLTVKNQCILQLVSVLARAGFGPTCIFTWFWGLGTPAEGNQGPKEKETNTILLAFLQGFGVLGEKVKG